MISEEKRAYNRAYYLAHKEELCANQRAYNAGHKEEKRGYNRAYYKANGEHISANGRAWRRANPEKTRESNAKWKRNNKDKTRKAGRVYYEANKEQVLKRQQKFKELNPEKHKATRVAAEERLRNDPVRSAKDKKRRAQYEQDVRKLKRWASPALEMLKRAKHRAKRDGGVCTITVADIEALNGTHCPVFGTQYEIGVGNPHSRSLDKIRPPLWYVPGNIAVISRRVNRIKQDATSDELYRMAECVGELEHGVFPDLQAGPLNDLMLRRGARNDTATYKNEMLRSARLRARQDGVVFTLTRDDFVVPERCPFLGVELKRGEGKLAPCSPTLDRIDPAKGYVPSNVIVICHRANSIKNDATAAEIRKVAEWLALLESSTA